MVESLLKRAKAFIGLEDEGIIEEIREEVNVESASETKRDQRARVSAEYEIIMHEPKVYEDSLQISTQLGRGSPWSSISSTSIPTKAPG